MVRAAVQVKKCMVVLLGHFFYFFAVALLCHDGGTDVNEVFQIFI